MFFLEDGALKYLSFSFDEQLLALNSVAFRWGRFDLFPCPIKRMLNKNGREHSGSGMRQKGRGL